MSVWLRLADPARQPALRLAVEGKLAGRDYYRFAAVGQPPAPEQPACPSARTWGQYIFQVDDLPLDGLSQLRVRFDLMGQGEVWIDDVQLFDLAFNERRVARAVQADHVGRRGRCTTARWATACGCWTATGRGS